MWIERGENGGMESSHIFSQNFLIPERFSCESGDNKEFGYCIDCDDMRLIVLRSTFVRLS